MNFKQLEAFYWLSQIQNYRQTAQRLGLTQPAVSARIQSLETDLGKTLIDRNAPAFRLTDQGMEVADFALQFLNLRETMNTRLLDKHKQRLTIGLAGMAALTWGPILLQRLRDELPEITLDVYSSSDLQLARFIDAGTLDLAFTAGGNKRAVGVHKTYFGAGRRADGTRFVQTRRKLIGRHLVRRLGHAIGLNHGTAKYGVQFFKHGRWQ